MTLMLLVRERDMEYVIIDPSTVTSDGQLDETAFAEEHGSGAKILAQLEIIGDTLPWPTDRALSER